MALGEMIGEESGSVSAFRVTKEGFGVKVETMFEGHGQILGADVIDYATYWSVYRPDGNFIGGANGVVFTPQAEAASYEGQGVGHMLGRGGAAAWRGMYSFFSASPSFAQLNSIAVLFEFEIDETAKNMTIKFYEWK
jgi:hypothetical protein